MRSIYFSDDLNLIKKRYDYEYGPLDYVLNNSLNYIYFKFMVKQLDFEKKFGELYKKMEKCKGYANEDKMKKNKKILEEITAEYKNIRKDAKAQFHFSDDLLTQLKKDFKKHYLKKGAPIIFKKVCTNIIDSAIKNYIKFEKKIIIILDIFNSINF